MSKIIFNEHQRRILEANPNVNSVSDRSIQYNPEFKLLAVKGNQSGKGPSQIFIENGFDLEMIGTKKAKESLSRWRRTYQLHGEVGFFEEWWFKTFYINTAEAASYIKRYAVRVYS